MKTTTYKTYALVEHGGSPQEARFVKDFKDDKKRLFFSEKEIGDNRIFSSEKEAEQWIGKYGSKTARYTLLVWTIMVRGKMKSP